MTFVKARVIAEQKGRYRLTTEDKKTCWGQIKGRFLHLAEDSEDFPAVGDWVHATWDPQGEFLMIEEVLPRKSCLGRRAVGGQGAQLIATNIDSVLIASSLNQDLNLNRLDRYVTMAWNSGAVPVIVLTKRDLSENWQELENEVKDRFVGVNVHSVSNREHDSWQDLKPYLTQDQTIVVVGSSGVGKSTLINQLVQAEVLITQEIRTDDDKGKHTTTSRSLWQTPWGGAVIDTPGMRELQLLGDEEGLSQTFEDIEKHINNCKFTDCQHVTEPGCAIRQAKENGDLDEERWQSYLKLQKEIHFQIRKQDKSEAAKEKKKWKKIHQDLKVRLKEKGRIE